MPTAADVGFTSLTTALLTPIFVVVGMMAFQAALWSHARSEARAVARDSAAMVARNGAAIADVESSAARTLEADRDLRHVTVELSIDAGLVVARIAGDAPGLLRGTSSAFEVVEAMPIEGRR
jgi:hypothetical protein